MTSVKIPTTTIGPVVFTEGAYPLKPGEYVMAVNRVPESSAYRCDCDVCDIPKGPTDDGPTLEEHATIIGKKLLGCGRVGCGCNLTERETAIVLCALRQFFDCDRKVCEDHDPAGEGFSLGYEEIENLCEKINFGGDAEGGEV